MESANILEKQSVLSTVRDPESEVDFKEIKKTFLATVYHYSDFIKIDELNDLSARTTKKCLSENSAKQKLFCRWLNCGIPTTNTGQEVLTNIVFR